LNKFITLLVLSAGLPALAATYTVPAGSSAATIQGIVNTAGSAAGNTVMFSAGSYSLAFTVTLPCSNGTIYTGPNVGVVSQTNLPTAVLMSTVPTNYAFSTDSNITSLTGSEGCAIEYLRFSGTQGGILVYYPASGITIQENAFDNNNPPPGGATSEANVFLTGLNEDFSPANGVQNISIVWNLFFDNCAAIRAVAWPDSGGLCAATWVDSYNNHLTWSNNTVNGTEEGLKFAERCCGDTVASNIDFENNNLQGNSRILIELQQSTSGEAVFSHNAFYQPFNPSYNAFEISIPLYQCNTSGIGCAPGSSPASTEDDNVEIANVPVTITGSGAHYGIGLELWGEGSIATNNLFQGGNGPESCDAGYSCSGWSISVGEAFTNAHITGNYFSGTDVWMGTPNVLSNAVTYEDGGSQSNPGLVLSPNTVVQTSTTIPTVAPTISPVSSSTGIKVTLSDSDTTHRLSIFYTTNGTTPAIFRPGGAPGTTQLYSAPFTVAPGTTVKAIASWGQGANQGIVFPSFGYVPSTVVALSTAALSAASLPGAKTITSGYLRPESGATTMTTGSTMQMITYVTYSDGSTGTLPDAHGNAVTWWNTTNHAVAKISSQGHATALATGSIKMEAMVGSLTLSPWSVTVGAPSAPAPAVAAAGTEAGSAPKIEAAVAADTQIPTAVDTEIPTAAGAQTPTAADAQAAASPGTQAPAAPIAQGALTALTAGPVPAAPGAAVPDTFLGPFWKLVTPAGGSASISNSHLFIGVPGGANHDLLNPSNQAVRLVQAIGNDDFDIAVKIDSPLVATDGNASQGLIVLSDDEDFLTFALTTDGSKIGLNAGIVARGVATTVLEDTDFSQYQNPMYLRLTKAGTAYVALYSVDGVNWLQAASFTDASIPTSVGLFAGNYSSTPANAAPVVMSVNWFDVQQ